MEFRFFHPEFRIHEDASAVTERPLTLLKKIPTGGRQVYDANIVATMLVYGMRELLTPNVCDFK